MAKKKADAVGLCEMNGKNDKPALVKGCFTVADIIDVFHEPVFLLNKQGEIVIGNKSAQKILNSETIKENDLVNHYIGYRNGEEFDLDEKKYLVVQSEIEENHGLVGSVIIWQDITLKKMAESELGNTQELLYELDTILKSSYDGIFVADKNGIATRYNGSYCRITGLDAAKLMGMNMNQIIEEGYVSESSILKVLETRDAATTMPILKSGKKVIITANPVLDDKGELIRVVANVRDITELMALNDQLDQVRNLTDKYYSELVHLRSQQLEIKDFVVESQVMKSIVSTALKVAPLNVTVMITGESGSGKEVLARTIHNHSAIKAGAFVKINCGAIPETLLESELFGYEKGAFTGASKSGKAGLFEVACGGTLFLDEIGEIPLSLQVKLLGVLQDFRFTRVGGIQTIPMNSRVIAATNRDLEDMVSKGQFRKDLYYRLNVISLKILPLAERRDDIFPLTKHFLQKLNEKYHVNNTLSPQVANVFERYAWPGNVREMENLIERLVVLAPNEQITVDMLPENLRGKKSRSMSNEGRKLNEIVDDVERRLFQGLLGKGYSTYKIAKELGISQPTVVRKIKKLEIY